MSSRVETNSKVVQTRRNSQWASTKAVSYTVQAAPTRDRTSDSNGYDVVDNSATHSHVYTRWDVFVSLVSIVSYIVDVGTDVSLAVVYYQQSRYTYFAWTTVFIVLPSVVISIFSLKWYILDHKSRQELPANYDLFDAKLSHVPIWKWLLRSLCIILQIAPLLRYVDALWYGWKTRRLQDERELEKRKFFYQMMLYEDADSTLLRLFEAFLESAPQLILQLYIMVNFGIDGEKERNYFLVTFQTGSVCMSLVSLAWSLVSYHKSLRYSRHNKKNMTYLGLILCFFWRICMLFSRVLAFALFASHYWLALLIVASVHWAVMTFWIVVEGIRIDRTYHNFCGSKTEQIIFDAVIGIVWIFCCFNIREGHTRKRYVIYYTIAYIENVALITIWYYFTQKQSRWFHLPSLIGVLSLFWLGIVFMLLYYHFSHPEGVPVCLPHSYWTTCNNKCTCEKCDQILVRAHDTITRTSSSNGHQELITTVL